MEGLTSNQLMLVGDSLLAQIGRDRTSEIERQLVGWVVLNCASGGFGAAHCRRQAEHLSRVQPTAVLVSVGTNDAVPEHGVTLADFERDLRIVLDAFPQSRRLVLLPPGVDEARQVTGRGRTNDQVDLYRATAARAGVTSQAAIVDGEAIAAVVRSHGHDPHVEDGVHLTDPMYTALADELGRLLR